MREEAIGFLKAFAMPNSILIEGLMGGDQRLLGSCRRLGVGHMSTELGGAAAFSVEAFRAAERGLPRLLRYVGVLKADAAGEAPPTQFYRRHAVRDFVYAGAVGVFESYVQLGDVVEDGQPAGVIHFTETPWRTPEPVVFRKGGTVLNRRAPARTKIGDCLFALGVPIEV